MNNRFKFRFWSKSFEILSFPIDLIHLNAKKLQSPQEWEDDVIMQCTGLEDKNGKLIYEGDILHEKNGGQNGVVVYRKENAGFCLDIKNISCYYPVYPSSVEIIGNIYENPELLKEGEKK
jgi:hypothetical protein